MNTKTDSWKPEMQTATVEMVDLLEKIARELKACSRHAQASAVSDATVAAVSELYLAMSQKICALSLDVCDIREKLDVPSTLV
jgi:hypothetical protein